MKNLESFEAAANLIGIDSAILPDVSNLPERFQKAQIAQYKLAVISEASWKQEDKTIDWYNWDQYKYYPWFDMSPEKDSVGSSRGFSYYDYNFDYTYSYVSSRLVYPSREIAEYVGQTHIELYRDLMVID
ncbi:hypothetical protein ACFSQ3_13055 [Sphingobacterium corticis]|uniref:Beta-N-acetylhexosaminidase n=1 Tax=Sphingobacterium corticis TaxID=1812823 RepID=A0ABW5NP81_9SPHI